MKGWYYSTSNLERVANNLEDFSDYEKLDPPSPEIDSSPTRLAQDRLSTKIDFDRALNAIGPGEWRGLNENSIRFGDYKGFGVYQQVIIADVLGITDYELEQRGFYSITSLRVIAYRKMRDYLLRGEL